jgi:hypothetical protein
MSRLLGHRPSPAMVVALLALSIAMAGTSYAAFQLPANSVVSKQTQANAVAAAPCDRGGATVVRASRQAVVVRWRVHNNWHHYWACLRSTRRAVLVGFAGYQNPDAFDEYVLDESKFSLGGRFVAVVSVICGEGCPSESVDVYDLRSRRRVRSTQLDNYTAIAKVLLGTRGALVLVVDDGERRRIEVRGSRGFTVVTQGPRKHIPVASMRVHGNLLRWRQAGMEHSFRMR